MELIASIVLAAAVLLLLTVFVGMLLFALAIARLVDRIHSCHLEDMRWHLTRLTDQVLAISEANMDEIRDRRDHEAQVAKGQAERTADLFRVAVGGDDLPEADRTYDFGGDEP